MQRVPLLVVLLFASALAGSASAQCTVLSSGCPLPGVAPSCAAHPTVGNASFQVTVQAGAGFTLIVYGLCAPAPLPTCASGQCGMWVDVTMPAALFLYKVHDGGGIPFPLNIGIPIPNLPQLSGVSFCVQTSIALGPCLTMGDALRVTIL